MWLLLSALLAPALASPDEAAALLSSGDALGALELLLEAPLDAEGHALLAWSWNELGEPRQALTAVLDARAATTTPSPLADREEAIAQLQLGHPERALAALTEIDGDGRALLARAEAHLALGDLEGAEADIAAAAALPGWAGEAEALRAALPSFSLMPQPWRGVAHAGVVLTDNSLLAPGDSFFRGFDPALRLGVDLTRPLALPGATDAALRLRADYSLYARNTFLHPINLDASVDMAHVDGARRLTLSPRVHLGLTELFPQSAELVLPFTRALAAGDGAWTQALELRALAGFVDPELAFLVPDDARLTGLYAHGQAGRRLNRPGWSLAVSGTLDAQLTTGKARRGVGAGAIVDLQVPLSEALSLHATQSTRGVLFFAADPFSPEGAARRDLQSTTRLSAALQTRPGQQLNVTLDLALAQSNVDSFDHERAQAIVTYGVAF